MRLRYLFALVAFALTGSAQAQSDNCTHVVSPSGDPYTTIGAAVDAVEATGSGAGAVICIRRGTYYESVRPTVGGSPASPFAIQAFPGDEFKVVVSGADAIPAAGWVGQSDGSYKWTWSPETDWEAEGGSGTSRWFTFVRDPVHSDLPHTQRREMLIAKSAVQPPPGSEYESSADTDLYDGHVMQAVETRQDLSPDCSNLEAGICGTFWVETASGDGIGRPTAIYAVFPEGRTPSAAEPMIAVRENTFMPDANYSTCGEDGTPGYFAVRGIVFRHTNNREQIGSVCPGSEGSTFSTVAVEFTNGTGLRTGNYSSSSPTRELRGNDHTFIGVRASSNGQLGFGGQCNDCTFQDGEISLNNWKGYDEAWEAGGAKMSFSDGFVFRRVRAIANRGPGIWFDIDNRSGVVEGVWADRNWDVGIFIELFSTNTLVQHNVVSRTVKSRRNTFSGSGIAVSTVIDNYLYHNTVVNNEGNGIIIRSDIRLDDGRNDSVIGYNRPSYNGAFTTVYNNVVVGNTTYSGGALASGLAEPDDVGANEIQVEETDGTGADTGTRISWVQTNLFKGNVIEMHEDPVERSRNQNGLRVIPAANSNQQGNPGIEDHLITNGEDRSDPSGPDPYRWRSEFSVDPGREEYLSYQPNAYAELWNPDNWGDWVGTLDLDEHYEEPTLPDPGGPADPHCYQAPGAHPEAAFEPFILTGEAPSGCTAVPNSNTVKYITSNRTITSSDEAEFAQRDTYVLPGATLTVNGEFTLQSGGDQPTRIFVLGTIVSTGQINGMGQSEVFILPLATDSRFNDMMLSGNGSCLMVSEGAIARVDGDITATNGGFVANRGGTLILGDGATMHLTETAGQFKTAPGAVFALGQGVDVVLSAPVQIVGTPDAPIRFERLATGSQWGSVRVEGDGSTLRHVLFDGGDDNLFIAADHVTVDRVTSRNGDHNLRTDFEDDLSDSYNLRITNSLFEDATYHGLNLYFTRASVKNTVVRGSGYHNVAVYVATVTGFGGNVVEDGNESGIGIANSGSLSFGYASPGPGAQNQIRNNAHHEVRVASGGSAYLGGAYVGNPNAPPGPNSQACNAITSTGGYSGSKLVYNASSQTVVAQYNYWGTSFPQPSLYYGSVNRSNALSSDPTAGGACSGGGIGGPGQFATAAPSSASSTTGSGDTISGTSSDRPSVGAESRATSAQSASTESGPSADEVAAMAAHMDAVRDSLSGTTGDVRDLLSDLYAVARADVDDATGRRSQNLSALAAVASALTDGAPDHRPSAELAAILLAREALARGETSQARTLHDRYAPHVAGSEHARSLLAFESSLLTAEGRFGQALTQLVAYEAAEAAHELVTPGYEAPDLSLYRETLVDAANRATPDVASVRQTPTLVPDEEALVTDLGSPYPNPTQSGVSLALTLAEAGRAEVVVYDVTGRQVATIASGEREKGTDVLKVDGSGLAPGIYLVRGTVSSPSGTESFVQRFTVVR